jgi:hypothetical protein
MPIIVVNNKTPEHWYDCQCSGARCGRLDLLFRAGTSLYFLAPHLKKLRIRSAHITGYLITAAPIPAIGPAPIAGGPAQGGDDRLLAAALPPGSPVLC